MHGSKRAGGICPGATSVAYSTDTRLSLCCIPSFASFFLSNCLSCWTRQETPESTSVCPLSLTCCMPGLHSCSFKEQAGSNCLVSGTALGVHLMPGGLCNGRWSLRWMLCQLGGSWSFRECLLRRAQETLPATQWWLQGAQLPNCWVCCGCCDLFCRLQCTVARLPKPSEVASSFHCWSLTPAVQSTLWTGLPSEQRKWVLSELSCCGWTVSCPWAHLIWTGTTLPWAGACRTSQVGFSYPPWLLWIIHFDLKLRSLSCVPGQLIPSCRNIQAAQPLTTKKPLCVIQKPKCLPVVWMVVLFLEWIARR